MDLRLTPLGNTRYACISTIPPTIPSSPSVARLPSVNVSSIMSKTYPLVILATAWLVAVPAPVFAQLLELSPSVPNPKICRDDANKLQSDGLSVESDAFSKPPYNRYDSREYNMWLSKCPSDNPGGCKNIKTWTYNQNPCPGGRHVPCKWAIILAQPRPVTVYFIVRIFDKANREVAAANNSQILNLTWRDEGKCPKQLFDSLTITVNGQKGCTAVQPTSPKCTNLGPGLDHHGDHVPMIALSPAPKGQYTAPAFKIVATWSGSGHAYIGYDNSQTHCDKSPCEVLVEERGYGGDFMGRDGCAAELRPDSGGVLVADVGIDYIGPSHR